MAAEAALRAEVAALSARVGRLGDAAAIRKLHRAYGYYIDVCMYDELVDLFAEDGEVILLSGVNRGKAGTARLCKTWFQNFFTGGRSPADPVARSLHRKKSWPPIQIRHCMLHKHI